MKLVHATVLFVQCIYAVAVGARQDGVLTTGTKPLAVIEPLVAPQHDIDDLAASTYYGLDVDPDVLVADNIEELEAAAGRLKRTMGMLRMGRSLDEQDAEAADKRTMGMLRMGRSDAKRAMGMLRMGRAMGMLRMGRGASNDQLDADETPAASGDDKRAMGMLRMGRSMGMLRMGRSSSSSSANDDLALSLPEKDKKSMSMLRMGKRSADQRQ